MSTRKVMLFVNLANLTGMLNHALSVPTGMKRMPIRIDYQKLLTFLADDRQIDGAYIISQQDPRMASLSSRHDAFLRNLSKFGWSVNSVAYDQATGDVSATESTILNAIYGKYVSADNTLTPDYKDVDLVFVNGSSSWLPIIQELSGWGFNCQIAFTEQATHRGLRDNYQFCDMKDFLSAAVAQAFATEA